MEKAMRNSMTHAFKILPIFLGLLLTGCPTDDVQDITSYYSQSSVLTKGYRLGGIYVLQRDIFVTRGDRPDYRFTEPGDGVPTVEEWRHGARKPQIFKVITLLPAGTKLRVEKIIFLKASGGGVSHATGMLRTDGVDLSINPFMLSNFLSVSPYGTLCQPDEKFLREER
jgi:hypothetical protein